MNKNMKDKITNELDGALAMILFFVIFSIIAGVAYCAMLLFFELITL